MTNFENYVLTMKNVVSTNFFRFFLTQSTYVSSIASKTLQLHKHLKENVSLSQLQQDFGNVEVFLFSCAFLLVCLIIFIGFNDALNIDKLSQSI